MTDKKELGYIKLIKGNLLQLLPKHDKRIKIINDMYKDLLRRSLPYNEKIEYRDLTPEKDIKNGDEYFKALDWALRNPDIKNIALSGPYGSGKSSIIQSYIKKHPNVKALNISLATFDVDNCQYDENIIEEGILKQLFYKVDAKKIPQSRYRKLRKISVIPYIGSISTLSIILTFVSGFFLTDKTRTLYEKLLTIGAYWGMGKLTTIIFVILVWMGSVLFLAFTFRWITKKFSLKEVNLADKAVLTDSLEDDKSIFNKNMDEIVYFFEETKYDTVFFEDLDRFTSTEIFIKLRELNTILNNYEQIKKRIAFIYAIKDDFFIKDERTKFFDFIIPVIPIINSTNSGEILREKLDIVEMKDGTYASSKYDISSRFVTLISPFIEDMRILTNICNEFVIYKNTLREMQSLSLKDELMFSMIVFKNLYPKDFSDLEAEKGIVKKAFNAKKDFVNNKINDLKDRIDENQTILENVEADVLQDLNEVKAAFINYLMDGGNYIFNHISNSHGEFSYDDIMKEDFDITQLIDEKITVTYSDNNYYTSFRNKTKQFINLDAQLKETGRDYFKRCKNIEQGTDERKEIIIKNIESDNEEISRIRSYSLSTLIKKYSSEEILPADTRENKLLVFLLRHGYIDENYTDYINYFHPNSITKDEMNFILGIRNHEAVGDFSYPLRNCSQILERIADYEFKQSEVLNFNLFDYMLLLNKKDYKYEEMILQITNGSAQSNDFIKSYLEREINLEIFIQEICNYSNLIWFYIVTDNTVSEETKYKYLKLILCYANIDDIDDNNIHINGGEIGGISLFIESHKDILQRLADVPIDKMISVIDRLEICFYELDTKGVDEDLQEHIFSNYHFELNHCMVENIFKLKKLECLPDLNKANYTTIQKYQNDVPKLINYINQSIEQYVQTFILDTEDNTEEDFESVQDIIHRLFVKINSNDDNNNHNLERIFKVIDKEPVIWKNLENCCGSDLQNDDKKKRVLKIWNYILQQNRAIPSWNNYSTYRDAFGVTAELIKFVEANIIQFIMVPDSSILNDNIIKEIIIENISLSSFKQFISKFHISEFTNNLDEFDEEKVEAMIEVQYFSFSAERYIELRNIYPNLCTMFILKNRTDFMVHIDDCELTQNEIVELLKLTSFSDDDKIKILNQIESTEIDERIALRIRQCEFRISKEYIEAAWNILSTDDKYELLINHIAVYNNDELAVKFDELGGVYQQLAERTRHKVTFHNDSAGYNKKLLNYLNKVDYLSSVKEVEHKITGMVKQAV